jgi:hypothetical protein
MVRRHFRKGFAIALAFIPAIAVAQPRAVVVEPVKDAGVVSRGTTVRHDFEIRNDGDQQLTIREVQPTCGCTVAEFDKTIEPGGVGRVRTVVDTQNFRGPIAKAVKVFTSDPDNARIDLVVKADIRAQIETRPGYARMVVVQGESVETNRQWLWAADGVAIDVEDVSSPFPFLDVSYRLAGEDERRGEGADRQWLIDLKLADNAPVGPMADHVIVLTNHPNQREVRIPVSGFVRPVLSVKPRIGDFGRLELTGPFTATFDVQNLGERDISILGATTDVEGISAQVEELDAGKRYRIELTLEQDMRAGDFTGTLAVETTSDLMPVVEVELSGTIL